MRSQTGAGGAECEISGTTPITVNEVRLRLSVLPTIDGSEPNCFRQKLSEITATDARARSSSSVKVRPINGLIRSTLKYSEATTFTGTTSAFVPSVRLKSKSLMVAIDSKTRLRARQSTKFG